MDCILYGLAGLVASWDGFPSLLPEKGTWYPSLQCSLASEYLSAEHACLHPLCESLLSLKMLDNNPSLEMLAKRLAEMCPQRII